MHLKRAILSVPFGYVLLSLLAWLLGWLSGGGIFNQLTAFGYIGTVVILGPLGFAFNLGTGVADGSMAVLWVLLYIVASALLVLSLQLIRRTSRLSRTMGIVLAVAVWLASAFLNFLIVLQGVG